MILGPVYRGVCMDCIALERKLRMQMTVDLLLKKIIGVLADRNGGEVIVPDADVEALDARGVRFEVTETDGSFTLRVHDQSPEEKNGEDV